ncbi:Oidioi.mRNA.OKI2018_I69.XSR.g13386.t1.cds [Oikopleura dioica]|uniref:Oidioi.mRNA.OKI2018_I69.XSR.g13386.t1.cds n=1 Tax=Oikopleura dioica TaxID=34765 RepID=A0ABN7S8G0_OIKDI|nr:Oidioi.mRNA.OKI2018_I69.XSR.g13386.t1.cds [Oikopleura dioica]
MIERRRSYAIVKWELWKYRQRMAVLFPDVLFRNRVIYKILDNLVAAWQKPSCPWHPVLFDKANRETVDSDVDSEDTFVPDTSDEFRDM